MSLDSVKGDNLSLETWFTKFEEQEEEDGSISKDESKPASKRSEAEEAAEVLSVMPPPYLPPALFLTIAANFPQHFSIDKTGGATLDLKTLAIQQQQIILQMLDKWAESNAKIAKMIKDEELHKEQTKPNALQQIIHDQIHNEQINKKKIEEPMASILIMSLVGVVVGAINSGMGSATSSSIITDTVQAATGVPMATQVAQELSLVAQGMVVVSQLWSLPVTFAFLKSDPEMSEQGVTRASARAYSTTLVTFINSNSFNDFLINRIQGLKIPAQKVSAIVSTIKVTLMISALALMYKVDTGSLTAGELKALISGKVKTPDDYMKSLITNIQTELAQIPEPGRSKLVSTLLLYYDKSPDVESMMAPAKAFTALWTPDARTKSEEALARKG